MKKTFFLGVGAQKAGTTWLYNYLSKQPGFNFGPLKEYHIWDALFINECRGVIANKDDALRYRLQNEVGAYERHFLGLFNESTYCTGDITPSYSGLSSKSFSLIKKKLEDAGFDVKVIFLMRDPFERCWSAIRMENLSMGIVGKDFEKLRSAYHSKEFIFRTDYKKTIEALEEVFEKSKIYYGIYEEMFCPGKIKELSEFCNVVPDDYFSGRQFNVSPKSELPPDQLRNDIRGFYSHVYGFCYSRFPQTRFLWAL